MAINNSTQVVTATKTGTGWTIDVTAANLSTDLTVKDFLVEFDSVVQDNDDFTKSSSTLLTYNGASIASTVVAVYRDTPVVRVQEVTYADRITSTLWENEFNRMHRILSELGSTIRLSESPVSSDDSTKAATTEWVRDLVGNPDSIRIIDLIDDDIANVGKPDDGTVFFIVAAGQSSLSDGNGGIIFWDENDTSTTIDNINVWQVDGDNSNGRWKRISVKQLNVKVSQSISQDENSDVVPPTSWVNKRSADISKINGGRLSNHASDIILTNLAAGSGRYSNGTLYLHRWTGDKIALYNPSTSEWELLTLPSTPVSISTAGLYDALKPHDVFVYTSGGSLILELVKWSSVSARATDLTRVDGVLCKAGDTGKRYLGSLVLNSSSQVEVGFNDDQASNAYNAVYLRNADNQIPCRVFKRRGQAISATLTGDGTFYNNPPGMFVGYLNGIAGASYNDPLAVNTTFSAMTRATTSAGTTLIIKTYDGVSATEYGNVNTSSRARHQFAAGDNLDSATLGFHEFIPANYRAGRNVYGLYGLATSGTVDFYYPSTNLVIQDLTW